MRVWIYKNALVNLRNTMTKAGFDDWELPVYGFNPGPKYVAVEVDMDDDDDTPVDKRKDLEHCLSEAITTSCHQDHVGWLVLAIRALEKQIAVLRGTP